MSLTLILPNCGNLVLTQCVVQAIEHRKGYEAERCVRLGLEVAETEAARAQLVSSLASVCCERV